MSDTPRTDAAQFVAVDPICGRDMPGFVVGSEFAREIERELAAAQARIAALEETLRVVNVEAALAGDEKARLAIERDRWRYKAEKKVALRDEFRALLGTDDIENGVAVVKALKANQCEEEPYAWHLTDSTHGLSMFHTYKPKGGTPLYRKKNHD